MNKIYNNNKGLRGEKKLSIELNGSIQSIQSIENNSNQSFHMRESVAKAGRSYARRSGLAVGDFAEKAFISYMENHPLEGTPIIIQNQIKSDIVDRLEVIQMSLIEKHLRLYMKRLVDKDGNPEYLRRTISKEVKRGVKIKKPSPEFLELLEEAVKLV